jgi:hypothetical protein
VFGSKAGQACTLVEQQTFTRFPSLRNASLNTIQLELSILNIGGGRRGGLVFVRHKYVNMRIKIMLKKGLLLHIIN